MESSLFDFKNATPEGLVQNTILSFDGSLRNQKCTTFSVPPAFVLFTPDFLQTQKAVFSGTVTDDIHGKVAAWEILFQNTVPVTVFLNANNTVVRYALTFSVCVIGC